MAPRVTIIIPTYNWSSVLPYSIGSVLRQTFTNFELLVIGDGCTDDSAAVVEHVGDSRVRWTNLPANTGHQSGPNNEGLRQAQGELIAYLGHDDLWLPHHLTLLVAAMDAGAGLAYGITEVVAADGIRVEPSPRSLDRYRPGEWLAPSGLVHHRSATSAVGGWPHYNDVNNDPESELWSRMAAAGVRFSLVPRLVAVKFPAGPRRDVYRRRPCHEQAACFERIGREPHFEAVELARLLAAAQRVPIQTLLHRASRRMKSRLRGVLGYRRGILNPRRKVKGLDPLP